MTDSDINTKNSQTNNSNTGLWGNIRKLVILALILAWLIGYFICIEHVDTKTFAVLAALVFVFIFDHIYSIALSAKASDFFKSFLLQTAVPLSALFVVAFLSYLKTIDSQATITMFGLALAYTTYVVGKRLKPETENHVSEPNDKAPSK